MAEQICSSTSSVLEAISDGDTPVISGPISLTIPLSCDLHCVGGEQTLVVRGDPTITVDGDASTIVKVMGSGSPTVRLAGACRAVLDIDVDEGAIPNVVIDENAAPIVTITRGTPNVQIMGLSQPKVTLRSPQVTSLVLKGTSQAQVTVETPTTAAWTIVYDEQAAGRIEVLAAGGPAVLTVQGEASPEVNLRQEARPSVVLAGASNARVYAWDNCASDVTASDDTTSTVSSYHQTNLTIVGGASAPLVVDAHHNSQLLVSGNVAVTPDRSAAVQVSGDGPTVTGTCMLQRVDGASPPVFEPPVRLLPPAT